MEYAMPREQNHKSRHAWQEIAQQIMREQNPEEVIQLLKKLNEAMLSEEREKVRRRLGMDVRNSLAR
jgi:ribosomal protein L31E